MTEFAHLHTHSDGSTPVAHDGLGTVSRLINAAKSKGFKSLALTDHGNLLNTPSFIHAAKLANIKPISGMEIYIEHNGDNFHLTLLADGNVGFETLIDLNNIAQNNWVNKRPAIKLTDFEKHNAGITVLTGCPSSPLQKLDYMDALDIGVFLKETFKDRLFAELMFVGFPDALERTVKLSKKLKIPIITTNDAHFPFESDAKIHQVLTQIHSGYDYASDYLFLATEEELHKRVNTIAPDFEKYYQVGITNAVKLANKLQSIKLENKLSLPKISNPDEQLKTLISQGLNRRYLDNELDANNKEILDRLDYEYRTITTMGFSTYFIILNDMVDYAKSIKVKIGAGRGSGAGSLILYTLGITNINPLEYDLKFERFINPKRLDFPDVDIDYDSEGRYKVIEYAKIRWAGIPVATYSRYSGDSLFNDLSRYFDIDKATNNKLKGDGYNSQTYKDFIAKQPLYGECYDAINGQIRHVGKHAGGVIITDKNVPTIKLPSGDVVASWTEGLHDKELSEIGVVKYDILGVSSLDVLAILEKKHGLAPKPSDNSPVFELFQKGDTLGIFQFGDYGITQYAKSIQPSKFLELVAINALWRPGAMQGAAPHYAQYKEQGQRLLHPLIDDILKETYGVICYQEQFMSIYAKVTDKDFGDADLARKILVKGQGKENNPEWKDKLDKLKNEIIRGCLKHGFTPELSEQIWNEIKAHSGYSFNKSHAVSYTMLSWQLAWYKYHFRTDFYAAALSIDDTKSEQYLFDVIKSGIEVVPPDINKSSDKYESDGKVIYMPLTAIKGISESGYQAIIANRPYTSIQDFVDKVPKRKVNKNARLKLYELGCFNNLSDGSMFHDFVDVDIDLSKNKTVAQIQKESLGFVLPTKAFFKAVKRAEKHKMMAGVINKIEDKKSKSGREYKRIYLYPSGIIRSYVDLKHNIGDEIMCKCKSNEYGNELIFMVDLEYV